MVYLITCNACSTCYVGEWVAFFNDVVVLDCVCASSGFNGAGPCGFARVYSLGNCIMIAINHSRHNVMVSDSLQVYNDLVIMGIRLHVWSVGLQQRWLVRVYPLCNGTMT